MTGTALGGGVVETPEARQLLIDWQKDGMVLYVTRDINLVMEFLQIDKTRPAYVEDMMGVYLRRKPWFEQCSNLHYHSQTVDESTTIAGWTSPLDDFTRFLYTMTGRSGALERVKGKNHSFFVALTAPKIQDVVGVLEEVTCGVDAIELRADLLKDPKKPEGAISREEFLIEQIALLRASTPLPLIFTLRSRSQGGAFPDEAVQEAVNLYRIALRMGFDFVDLELTAPKEVKDFVLHHRKMCVIIASHHDPKGELSWSDDGEDWIPFFEQARTYGDIVKLIGVAKTSEDNDELKEFKKVMKSRYPDVPVIAMNMGDVGKMSRVTNGFMTPVSHPALPTKAAPGQVSAAEIRKVLGIVGEIPRKEFFILGKPVGHSRSPALHNRLFERTGLPHNYGLWETDVVHEKVVQAFREEGFGGASVTIPLKVEVMKVLDEVDQAARTIGAVNTVVPVDTEDGKRKLVGHNTDWQGIVLALRNAGAHGSAAAVAGGEKEAGMVIGGGGTARAAIYALKQMGHAPIYLVGRNKAKLSQLVDDFDDDYGLRILSSEDEVETIGEAQQPVVAVGTIPGDSPIDPALREILCAIFELGYSGNVGGCISAGSLRPRNGGKVLLEMAYKPSVTSLMMLAENSGWKAVPGLEPLVGQGVHQFRLWTGIRPVYEEARGAVMETGA
jgi:pentafunctional AROM polypeptide